MRVAITGATGLIGRALSRSLTDDGHEVLRLVRRTPTGRGEVRWDPTGGEVDLDGLEGVTAVVHLAGAGVGDHRWSDSYKRQIRESRVAGTRTMASALCRLDPLPDTFVSASAIGLYGDRGEEVLTEDSPAGSGFLAQVVRDWEAAALPAAEAGIRVVHPRTGLVMSRDGGAFGRLVPLVRLGLGGPLGNGRQWWSWITMADEVRALRFLLTGDLAGPVNLTAPAPARNAEVTRAVGRAFHRPTLLPAPAFALRLVLGEFADDVLASQRVVPERLQAAGFRFEQPALEQAAQWLAAQPAAHATS